MTPLVFDGRALRVLDQRALPLATEWRTCTTASQVAEAIRGMAVRGAPAIGIAAAYGLAVAVAGGEDLEQAATVLLAARPTAINLRWAVERVRALPTSRWADEARQIHREDLAINRAIGDHGATWILDRVGAKRPIHLLHHCNTGALATGGWGTALGFVRSLHAAGVPVHVWVDETRPWLQGARLTAWELQQEGIPCTLHADSVAAVLMARGQVDAVVVGCDRVAANGDFANKTGTYGLGVLARAHGVPLIVGMPLSSVDPATPDGAAIPIEERPASEVYGAAGVRWAPEVGAYNPAFDVTPAGLVAAWISERGPLEPPFDAARVSAWRAAGPTSPG